MGRTRLGPDGRRLDHEASKKMTRRDLLNAGAELLITDREGRFAEARLRVSDITGRAGVSNGAFYDHFGDLNRYMQDLLRFALSPERYDDEFEAIATEFEQAPGDGANRFAAMADKDLETLLRNPYWTTQASYALSAAPGSEASQFLHTQYEVCDGKTVDAYWPAIEALGLATVKGVDKVVIAQLLQALVEGVALRAKVDPAVAEPDSGAKGISLYALGAMAIVSALTEPADSAPEKSRRSFLATMRSRWKRVNSST